MKYEGNLYGKIGRRFFDTGKTSEDWDKLESTNKALLKALTDIVIATATAKEASITILGEWYGPDLDKYIKANKAAGEIA